MLAHLLATAAALQAPEFSADVSAAMESRAASGNEAFLATIEQLIARDDASAIELMGELLINGGLGLPRDTANACALFTRAAGRRGDAAHNLARCYERGEGLALDKAKAREWYAKAAGLGYLKSGCALGNMMIAGAGGAKDVAGGIALCRKAAEAGDPDAQTDYGNFFLMGQGVERDFAEARRWYTLAAVQGTANAQFVLGQIYWKGDGTPVDGTAAAEWWKRAYAGGRKDAAGLIVGELFGRMVTTRDGKQTVDRALLPETVMWLERAVKYEPDAERRRAFEKALNSLRSGG